MLNWTERIIRMRKEVPEIGWGDFTVLNVRDPKAEYIMKNGKATAVILPLKRYTELLEDLQDLAVIARRKNEQTIPLAEVKARLRRNGALRR